MKVDELIKVVEEYHHFNNRHDDPSVVVLYDGTTDDNDEEFSTDILFISYNDDNEVDYLSVVLNSTEIVVEDFNNVKYIENAVKLLTDTSKYIDDYTGYHMCMKSIINILIEPILNKYGFIKCYDSMNEIIFNKPSEFYYTDYKSSHFLIYEYKYRHGRTISIRTDLITRELIWDNEYKVDFSKFEVDLINNEFKTSDGKYKLSYEWMFTDDPTFNSDSSEYIYELLQNINDLKIIGR